MRRLHQIVKACPIYWAENPCSNSYHRGYEYERTQSHTHGTCIAISDLAAPDRPSAEHQIHACYCDCTCRTASNMSHYFWTYPDEPEIWRLGPTFELVCPNCWNGNHPTP